MRGHRSYVPPRIPWGFATFLLIAACSGASSPKTGSPRDWPNVEPAPTTNRSDPMSPSTRTVYFPEAAWGTLSSRDGSDRNLERVNEPSLLAVAGSDVEAYRCFGRPSFGRSAVVRVVARPGARAVIIAKYTTSGFEPNVRERAIPLDKEDWRELQSLVVSVGFWSRPLTELEYRVADGTTVVVEGVRMGRYHLVASHSPDASHPDRVICDYLFSLAGDWP